MFYIRFHRATSFWRRAPTTLMILYPNSGTCPCLCAQSISLALRLECLQHMVRVIFDHVVLDAAPTSSSRSPTKKDVFSSAALRLSSCAPTRTRGIRPASPAAPPRNCHGLMSAHSSLLAFNWSAGIVPLGPLSRTPG